MKLVGQREVPLDDIIIGERISAVDENWVEALALSFRDRGQGQAIQLAEVPDGMPLPTGLHLMAGAHRLSAARAINWPTIRADVFAPETENPGAEMRLHESDENLLRRNLVALERAGHLAERKAAYEAIWPETRKGGQRGNQHTGGQPSQTDKLSFSQATAQKTGISERTIQRAVHIWDGLSPDVRDRLTGTRLADNAAQLGLLADLPEPKQVKCTELMLAEGGPRDVATAQAIVEKRHVVVEDTPTDRAFKGFLDLWARASTAAQKLIVEHLVGLGVALPPADDTAPESPQRKPRRGRGKRA